MRLSRTAFCTLLVAIAFAAPLLAVTASDVLERMSEKEQFGYITGAIDTMLYLEQVSGKGSTPRSACILEWYYGKNAPGPKQVVAMFNTNRDKSAVGLIKILIDRTCGAGPGLIRN